MKNRLEYYIKVASYEEREKIWKETIEATEKHIRLGLTLQGQGVEVLKNAQENTDIETIAKLIQQGTATIEKGIKIERDARDKLMNLYQSQPK